MIYVDVECIVQLFCFHLSVLLFMFKISGLKLIAFLHYAKFVHIHILYILYIYILYNINISVSISFYLNLFSMLLFSVFIHSIYGCYGKGKKSFNKKKSNDEIKY